MIGVFKCIFNTGFNSLFLLCVLAGGIAKIVWYNDLNSTPDYHLFLQKRYKLYFERRRDVLKFSLKTLSLQIVMQCSVPPDESISLQTVVNGNIS